MQFVCYSTCICLGVSSPQEVDKYSYGIQNHNWESSFIQSVCYSTCNRLGASSHKESINIHIGSSTKTANLHFCNLFVIVHVHRAS